MRNRRVCLSLKSSLNVAPSSEKPAATNPLPSGALRSGARRFSKTKDITAKPPHQTPANRKQIRAAYSVEMPSDPELNSSTPPRISVRNPPRYPAANDQLETRSLISSAVMSGRYELKNTTDAPALRFETINSAAPTR